MLEARDPGASQLLLACLQDKRGITSLLLDWFLHLQHQKLVQSRADMSFSLQREIAYVRAACRAGDPGVG